MNNYLSHLCNRQYAQVGLKWQKNPNPYKIKSPVSVTGLFSISIPDIRVCNVCSARRKPPW